MAVRRERIILDVEDNATAKFASAAASAQLLDRSVNKLGGTSTSTSREIDKTTTSTDRLGESTRRSGSDLNNYTGRLGALADAAIILGPALVPLGAATIPVLTASLAGLGAAAGGIGATVLAFQGVGDAVKAINAYDLTPTEANLKKMHLAMRQLGPDAREFAKFTADLEPSLKQLQSVAAAGVFPGLEAGITDLLTRLPAVRRVVSELAHGMGELALEAGGALSSKDFAPFFSYLKSDAEPTLIDFGRATGNVVETVANLFVAFAPLNRDFTGGLVSATQAMANWSEGLDKNTSFQGFLDYLRENGPRAVALLGSLAETFGSIVQASAPIGANILPVLTQLSNIVGVIARSDIGTPLLGGLVALRLYGRAAQGIALAQKEMIGLGLASKTTGVSLQSTATGLKRIASSPAGILAMAGAVTLLGNALADATGAKIKTDDLQRNLESLADGKNSDLLKRINNDLQITSDSLGKVAEPIHEAVTAFGLFGNTGMDNAADNIHQVDEALAQLVESGNADEAAKVFQQIEAAVYGGLPGASHSKSEIDGLMKSFGAYGTALGNVKPAADDASGAIDGLTGAVTGNKSAQQQLASAINAANQKMKAQRDAALGAFDAETQYRQAVKDAAAQAAKSDAGIRGSTDAALANRSALSNLAGAWNNQSAAVKNNVGRYKEARQNFLDTAEAMKVPQARAKALANQLLDIPRSTVAKVTADTGQAMNSIAHVQQLLANLHDKTVYIRLTEIRTGAGGQGGGFAPSAGGSTVPKSGRGYADRYPYMLADGEEVISNRYGQADRHRALLKAINANMHFAADGGLVGNTYARTPAPGSGNDAPAQVYVLGTAAHEAAGGLKGLKAQAAVLAKELSKAKDAAKAAKDALQSLKDQRASAGAAAASPFLHDAFGNGLAGLNAQVAADTNDAAAMLAVLKDLVSKGLDPHSALFAQLAASGDLNTARQLDALTSQGIASEQAAFATLGATTGQLGSFVGASEFNDSIKQQTKVYNHLDNAVHDLTHAAHQLAVEIKQMEAHIKKAAHDGTKSGSAEGTKAAQNGRNQQVAAHAATTPSALGRRR